MRTVKRALSLALLSLWMNSSTAHGGEEREKNVQLTYLSNQLINHLVYPEFLLGQMGEHTAEIHFMVSPEGTLNLVKIETDTPRLSSYIQKHLNAQNVYADSSLYGHHYSLQINFR